MQRGKPIHVGPEHDGSRHHLEANSQQVIVVRMAPTKEQLFDEEQILQVLQVHNHQCVERTVVQRRILYLRRVQTHR